MLDLRATIAIGFISFAAGCSSEGEKLAPVGGSITANGKAVPSGTLTFYPDSTKGNARPGFNCGDFG